VVVGTDALDNDTDDFSMSEVTPLLQGFHVVISPQQDMQGSNTRVVPGFDFSGFGGQETAPISEFVMPYGEAMNGAFEEIAKDMRAGVSNQAAFDRITKSGEEDAPVEVTSLVPIDASDWTRGVKVYRTNVFLLALGETATGIFGSFDAIQESLQRTANISVGILISVIVLNVLAVLYLSS
jgi:hypothetical protein